jgi:hypothetical protein
MGVGDVFVGDIARVATGKADAFDYFTAAATVLPIGKVAGKIGSFALKQGIKYGDDAIGLADDGLKLFGDASKSVKEFDIVPYRPTNSPLVNHHGINDVWAKNNVPGYVSRAADNPTIALSETGHKAAHKAGNEYLKETVGAVRGQSKKLSPRQMQEMAERQFDAAKVPQEARQNYYREFNRYIYGQ